MVASGIAALGGLVLPEMSAAQQPNTFTVIATGLQAPRGLKFGPDGDLYVAGLGGSNSTAGMCQQVPGPPPGPYTGGSTGRIEEVITKLNVPTGMTFGPDGRLYISDFGAVPAPTFGVGRILRFDVPPGW